MGRHRTIFLCLLVLIQVNLIFSNTCYADKPEVFHLKYNFKNGVIITGHEVDKSNIVTQDKKDCPTESLEQSEETYSAQIFKIQQGYRASYNMLGGKSADQGANAMVSLIHGISIYLDPNFNYLKISGLDKLEQSFLNINIANGDFREDATKGAYVLAKNIVPETIKSDLYDGFGILSGRNLKLGDSFTIKSKSDFSGVNSINHPIRWTLCKIEKKDPSVVFLTFEAVCQDASPSEKRRYIQKDRDRSLDKDPDSSQIRDVQISGNRSLILEYQTMHILSYTCHEMLRIARLAPGQGKIITKTTNDITKTYEYSDLKK